MKHIFIAIVLTVSTFFSGLWQTNKTNTPTTETPVKTSVSTLLPVEKTQIQEKRLDRLSNSKGLISADSTDKYIEEQSQVAKNNSQLSNYQAYVTPNDSVVSDRAKGKSIEEIYKDSLTWVWVEDEVLNGVPEKWLLPDVFLSQTPTFPTNPTTGRIASDCEEHAYTLVSMLRAAGVSADDVRVVTGEVNFAGGETGGHAWVEMYDRDKKGWFQLEPSSGDNYDSKTKHLIKSDGLPYDYFKTHQYPVVEVWTYFNDQYFWDNNRQQGVRPSTWESGVVEKSAPSNDIKYVLPQEVQKDRQEYINRFRPQNYPSMPIQITVTPSITPLPQPTVPSIQSLFNKFALAFNYLQQSNRQSDMNNLINEIINETNSSSLTDTQKQTLVNLANKIKNAYSSTITREVLLQLRSEILTAFNISQPTQPIPTITITSPTVQPRERRQFNFFHQLPPTISLTLTPILTP